jgi:hypothetical protein
MKRIVFPDTNIFLHFESLDQIDLTNILECDEVELVLAPVVIEELDQQKWDHPRQGIRKRAESSLKRIRSWIAAEGSPIRSQMFARLGDNPLGETLEKNRLDPRSRDDRLIASALECKDTHGRDVVFVLTNDFGPGRKAESLDLQTIELSDDHKLPPVQDSDQKEIIKLRKELARYQSRAPNLELRFVNESDTIEVRLGQQLRISDEATKAKLDKLKLLRDQVLAGHREAEEQTSRNGLAALALSMGGGIPAEEIERYKEEFEAFLEASEQYFPHWTEVENRRRRTVELNLKLLNSGHGIAEGIILILTLPDKLQWYKKSYRNLLPEEPTPPNPPRTRMEMLGAAMDSTFVEPPFWALEDALASASRQALEDRPVKQGIQGQELRWDIKECLHNRQIDLEPVYASFSDPGTISNFQIEYQIHERNTPDIITGKLLVRVGLEDQ